VAWVSSKFQRVAKPVLFDQYWRIALLEREKACV
jgi:hypothetical protein